MVVSELRAAATAVASQASWVRIVEEAPERYAGSLGVPPPPAHPQLRREDERRAAVAQWLSLDAINFGSGWFPTLVKAPGATGYRTVSGGWHRWLEARGTPTGADLQALDAPAMAQILGQDEDHELMGLFAHSLNDLGRHLHEDYDDDWLGPVAEAGGSAVALVEVLLSWVCFADRSTSGRWSLPFAKRAQIAAADLARAGAARWDDLDLLTMFADNLVPHVLALDGVLAFSPAFAGRIARGELVVHGSPEEVEMRACAVEAVERMVAALGGTSSAAELDALLWERGQGARYKAVARPRSRNTAY